MQRARQEPFQSLNEVRGLVGCRGRTSSRRAERATAADGAEVVIAGGELALPSVTTVPSRIGVPEFGNGLRMARSTELVQSTQCERKKSAISRFPTSPMVVFKTRSTSSSSLALTVASWISRKINAASKPTRFFPSTNG